MANAERCGWCNAELKIGPRTTRKKFCGGLCRDSYWNAARSNNVRRGDWRRRKYGDVMPGFSMAEVEKAYVAGFFDGEGHLGIVRERRKGNASGFRFKGIVEVSNTNSAVLARVQELLKGNCYRTAREANNRKFPNAKPLYRLKLTVNQARVIVPLLLPFFVVKKPAAELLLKFFEAQDQLPMRTSRESEALETLWEQMKALNHRGT